MTKPEDKFVVNLICDYVYHDSIHLLSRIGLDHMCVPANNGTPLCFIATKTIYVEDVKRFIHEGDTFEFCPDVRKSKNE